MKILSRIALFAIVTGSLTSVTQAHPGHGVDGPTHYVASPEHLGLVLVLVAACLLLLWSAGRKARRSVEA